MLSNAPDDLREMGLENNTDNSTVENILLGDLTRRAEIHTEFARTNRTQSKHVNWGKEKPEKPDGMRCNFPVILCELEATIPADQGTAAKNVPKKIFMDKEETGNGLINT